MRRLVTCALVLASLVVGAVGPAFGGSDERKGTGGAMELRIPVGPRGSALGGTVVGDASGVEALFWNPAGLASVQRTDVMFSHTQYFADMKLNYAALAANLGNFGVLGFDAKVLSIGDVIVTTEDAPDGTGQIETPTFSVLGVSYAKQFTDRVLFGMTVNYVNEKIIDNTAGGVAFDFGVQYLTGWNGLKIGMVMKNFGPSMQFSGSGFETNFRPPDSDPSASNRTFSTTSAKFEMPSFFTLGATYDIMSSSQQRLAFLGAFQNNNFTGDNVRGGLEWSYRNMFALRGSYFGTFNSTFDPVTANESSTTLNSGDDLYTGFALGGGASVRTGDQMRIGVDFAYKPVRNFFSDVYELGLHLNF